MKKTLNIPFALCILAMVACQQPQPKSECPPIPFTDVFLTSMQLKPENGAVYTNGSYENIQKEFYTHLIKNALNESVKVGDPLYSPLEEPLILTKAEIERKLIRVDTVYVENPEPPHELSMKVMRDTLDADRLISIRAYEKWYLTDSLKLNREVTSYVPVCEMIDIATGQARGKLPIFQAMPEAKGERKKVATVQYLQPIRADKKSFWFHNNLETSARYKLFNPVFNAAWSGAIPVYSAPDGDALTKDELRKNLCFIDTMYIESPEPPYDLQMTVVEECQSQFYDQVDAINLVQDVYIDENLALSYEVKWYAPVMKVYNRMTGEPTGKTQTMFWVKN